MKIPQAQYGDILAVHSYNPGASLVRWWTDGIVDHIACCIGDGLIIDARPFRGVQQHPIEFGLENHSWILLRLKSQFNSVSADKQAASKAWLQSNIGKGYDWKGLAGFPLSREMDSKNRFYCSELCFGWKRQEGIILIERTPDGLVSPQNILGCPLLEVIDVDWKEKNQSIPGV